MNLTNNTLSAPKVFISYSWSNQEYINKIIGIAEALLAAGIDVLLDKWDLKEGADIHAYMEKCASDKTITKVLIFSDFAYASKADSRTGGVGKETLIITPEVYGQEDVTSKEQRYIPIVMEKNASGDPCLPVYLKGRNFVDMTGDEPSRSLEQIIRLVFDKPFHKKPKLGTPPSYIQNDESAISDLFVETKSAINAIREHKPYALGRCKEYFEAFKQVIGNVEIEDSSQRPVDNDLILSKIEMLLPLCNECHDVISILLREFNTEEAGRLVHSFFEELASMTQMPENTYQWNLLTSAHYRFILYELFLSTVAITLELEHFIVLKELLDDYYYSVNKEYKLNKFSCLADLRFNLNEQVGSIGHLLQERCRSKPNLKFEYVMQADAFLFISSRIMVDNSNGCDCWYPRTLVLASYRTTPFKIFAKARSKKYCDKLLEVWGKSYLGNSFRNQLRSDEIVKRYKMSEVDIYALCAIDDFALSTATIVAFSED